MIIDARQLEDGIDLETDVCIVGGGAVGITIARELRNTNLDICVLESGGLTLEEECQALAAGETTGIRYFDLIESRFRMFGGSTYRWGARGAPMKEIDFQKRLWIPYSGWPLSLKDLGPYYERAHSLMGWHRPFYYDACVWDHFDSKPPAFDPESLQYSAFQFGKILLFGDHYRKELRTAANVRVYLHAVVTNFQSNCSGNHLEYVDLCTLEGKKHRARARCYVLASGGIENPRLLLLSTNTCPRGLCNDNDLVGRFFMEHPTVSVGKIVASDLQRVHDVFSPGLIGGRLVEVGLALSPKTQASRECCNAIASTRPVTTCDPTQVLREVLGSLRRHKVPEKIVAGLGLVLRSPGSVLKNVGRHMLGKPKRFRMDSLNLEIRTEQEPNPDSRVTLSETTDELGLRRPHLHWTLTERDKLTMRVMAETFGSEFQRLGLGELRLQPWINLAHQVWPKDMVGGHHHMGTTRMSDTPQRGIVDVHCRAHAVDNLYIAGSSVFATAGFVNPTPTILALALRLSDHLKTIALPSLSASRHVSSAPS